MNILQKKKNGVCYLHLKNYNIKNICNKSFIELNMINVITNIVEKKVISEYICVGGYSFENAKDYVKSYNNILIQTRNNFKDELYTSHIIWNLMFSKHIFIGNHITNFIDWGTFEDWKDYLNSLD